MVTVGIFVFMTALLLAKYNNFNSGTLLTNLAYDVALTLRQAQTYGLSVVNSQQSGANFSKAYGVYFVDESAEYTFFVDFNTKAFNTEGILNDTNDAIESISKYTLKRGATVTGLCAVNDTICSSSDFNKTHLGITFKRPDPDAIIKASTDGSNWDTYNHAEIRVSQNGVHRIIKVNSYGQIGIQD
jgi:hypothetical protein